MSNEIAVTLITVVLGGIITLIIAIVNSRAERAKTQISENTSEVQALKDTVAGMRVLTEEQRAELNRANETIAKRDERIATLETENRRLKRARRPSK